MKHRSEGGMRDVPHDGVDAGRLHDAGLRVSSEININKRSDTAKLQTDG